MRRLPKLTPAQRQEIDEARKARVGRAIERMDAARRELERHIIGCWDCGAGNRCEDFDRIANRLRPPLPAAIGRHESDGTDPYALDPGDNGRTSE